MLSNFVYLKELSHLELFGTMPAETTWLSILTSWMNAYGKSLLCKTSLACNLLLIFAQLEVFPLVNEVSSRQSRSSLGGLTGHKGSVSLKIKFRVSRRIIFCFIFIVEKKSLLSFFTVNIQLKPFETVTFFARTYRNFQLKIYVFSHYVFELKKKLLFQKVLVILNCGNP